MVKEISRQYKIYKHTNKLNNKVYIGVTKQDVEDRWGSNGANYRYSTHFYRAIQKYGWDNFDHEILEIVDSVDEASEKERYWIRFYDSTNQNKGYNLDKGGYSNREFSDITKQRMSESHMGDKNWKYGKETPQKTRDKISKAVTGKHVGELNSMYGKTHTDNVKKRLSEANQRDKPWEYKPVYCITTNRYFISIKEVKDVYHFNTAHITDVCKGRRKHCGRDPETGCLLEWRYATEEETIRLFKERGLEEFLNVKSQD